MTLYCLIGQTQTTAETPHVEIMVDVMMMTTITTVIVTLDSQDRTVLKVSTQVII